MRIARTLTCSPDKRFDPENHIGAFQLSRFGSAGNEHARPDAERFDSSV